MDLMDIQYTEKEFNAAFENHTKNTNTNHISKSEITPFIRKIASDSFGI